MQAAFKSLAAVRFLSNAVMQYFRFRNIAIYVSSCCIICVFTQQETVSSNEVIDGPAAERHAHTLLHRL